MFVKSLHCPSYSHFTCVPPPITPASIAAKKNTQDFQVLWSRTPPPMRLRSGLAVKARQAKNNWRRRGHLQTHCHSALHRQSEKCLKKFFICSRFYLHTRSHFGYKCWDISHTRSALFLMRWLTRWNHSTPWCLLIGSVDTPSKSIISAYSYRRQLCLYKTDISTFLKGIMNYL